MGDKTKSMTPRDLVDQKKINQYKVEFAKLAAVRLRRYQLLTKVYSEANGVDPAPITDVPIEIFEGRISDRKLDHTRIYTAIYGLVGQTMQISTTTSRRPGDDPNGWNQMARELTKAYKAMGYDKTFTEGDVDQLIDRLDVFTTQEAETFDETPTGGAADESEINQYSGSAPSRQGVSAPDNTATPDKCRKPCTKGMRTISHLILRSQAHSK